MDITNLLKAGFGFAAGFGMGLGGMPEEREDVLDVIVLLNEKSEESVKEERHRLRNFRLLFPIAAGAGYSLLYAIAGGEHPIQEALPITLGVYIGQFASSRIRRLWSRTNGLRRVLNDPYNFEKCLLNKEKRDIVRQAYGKIEETLLRGEEDIEKDLISIYEAIKGHRHVDILELLHLNKLNYISKRAKTQKTITDYFENTDYKQAIQIGEESTDVRVYAKFGDELITGTIGADSAKIIQFDRLDSKKTTVVNPQFEEELRRPWTGDYHELTNRALRDSQDYCLMFLNLRPDLANHEKAILHAYSLPFGTTREKR